MNRTFTIWMLATVILATYCAAGWISSRTTTAQLALVPGTELHLKLFRLFNDRLRLLLDFKAVGCQQRPELGGWRSHQPERPGFLTLTPGAEVRIAASTHQSAHVIFDAMPLSGFCGDINRRKMTADLPVSPGVYRWPQPATSPYVQLFQGINDVRLTVENVDPPLVGGTVTVMVTPPLGFNVVYPNVRWLWPGWFLWPIYAISQLVWGLAILWQAFARQRARRATAA